MKNLVTTGHKCLLANNKRRIEGNPLWIPFFSDITYTHHYLEFNQENEKCAKRGL
jgi:hypothetical protein